MFVLFCSLNFQKYTFSNKPQKKMEYLTFFCLRFIVYSLRFTVYGLQFTVYSLRFTVYSLRFTVYS